MSRRSLFRSCLLLASVCLCSSLVSLHAQDSDSHHARKYKAPPLSARIEVTVLRDSSGKPIQDAHVIFHPIEGDKDKGYLELKTNEDGKAIIDVLPIGDTVRMQIIARGFQTYGQDYKVDKPEMSLQIRMKRPGAQYSIYNNDSSAKSGSSSSSGQSGSSSQNARPAPEGKSSGSGSQPEAQANPAPAQPPTQ